MLQKEPEVTIHTITIAYAFQCVNTAEFNMQNLMGQNIFSCSVYLTNYSNSWGYSPLMDLQSCPNKE